MNTPDEWWEALNENWPSLLRTAALCGAPLGGPVVATFGEAKDPWEDIVKFCLEGQTLASRLAQARKDQDHAFLHRFLEHCWNAAPDAPYIHSWPSWSALCDLCANYEVFNPTCQTCGGAVGPDEQGRWCSECFPERSAESAEVPPPAPAVCAECRGEGGALTDSGGFTPWGAPIEIWKQCATCGGKK